MIKVYKKLSSIIKYLITYTLYRHIDKIFFKYILDTLNNIEYNYIAFDISKLLSSVES